MCALCFLCPAERLTIPLYAEKVQIGIERPAPLTGGDDWGRFSAKG